MKRSCAATFVDSIKPINPIGGDASTTRRYALSVVIGLVGLVETTNVALAQRDTTITVRAYSSTLEYVPDKISVKAGTRLTIKFVNEGTYAHNVVVPKKDDDIDDLAQAAITAGETGFVPANMKDKLLAWTQLISPGETGELTFVVAGPGSYTFVCLFPGHAQSMLGTIKPLK
jgi:plastocyanin